ncbi:MAG: AfsR/SARP family transcriptional regulator [Actinomycetota bacterium]|nr:AfsR/SARP family transcriptional regulator [Actinomycetota bacterium]
MRATGAGLTSDATEGHSVEVRILGPLEVVADGGRVNLPAGKARLLLAALVVHMGQVVSTDRLFEFLWGGQPPETAANTLQTYVSHLRQALEPARGPRQPSRLLVTREPGYLLDVDPGQVDAVRFERLVDEARQLLRSVPGEAADTLGTALSLWRGEPLADFTFEPFAQATITRLTELRLTALEDRAEADLVLGAHDRLCGELAQLVGEYPLRERLRGQLMVALYRCGRQAEALTVYTELRETLAEQLGIDPSPALGRLEQAILQQRAELNWPPLEAAPEPSPTPVVVGHPPAADSEATLASARDALGRRRWQEAFELFSAADEAGPLRGEDLDGLAEAALWLGRPHASLLARQRACAAFTEEGDVGRAAMAASFLSLHFAARLRFSVAGGWFQRAERLLADEPEGPEHGFLAWAATMFAIATGDHTSALQAAQRVFDLGCRFGVPDLQALGLTFQGFIHVHRGELAEGMRLMDEGMTWAVGGQLAPFSSALIFCRTISTCYELADYRRAAEWMDAIAGCFARTGINTFPGDCEAHSAGILVGRGAWSEGELRARRACAGMEPIDLAHVGLALSEIGEIRLRLGDLEGAEEAFAGAAETGAIPQPGLALLRLAQRDAQSAATSIAVALADETWNSLARARLLPAQVEIALANGDVETVRRAADELGDIADRYASPALMAAAKCARGASLLADDDAAAAVASLRRGIQLWREASAPYDAAKARARLAEALLQEGERAQALLELEAARTSFESLGARLDVERAAQLAEKARGAMHTAT